MTTSKKIGLVLLFGPTLCLVGLNFVFLPVLMFLSAQTGDPDILLSVIQACQGWLSIFLLTMAWIGVPFGLAFILKREVKIYSTEHLAHDVVDANGVPEAIKGWNWGAFGLTPFWGCYYGVWFSLLIFVPVISTIVRWYLAIKGNEVVWRRGKWSSVEAFKESQAKWRIWGIIGFILSACLGLYLARPRLSQDLGVIEQPMPYHVTTPTVHESIGPVTAGQK